MHITVLFRQTRTSTTQSQVHHAPPSPTGTLIPVRRWIHFFAKHTGRNRKYDLSAMFRLINRAQARLRLPPPYAPFQRRHSSRKASDPLRILFCGSDAFSCESLRALHRENVKNRALVEALDVMVLPGRRTGRGLRTVREGEDSAPPSFLSLCLIIWTSKFLALLLHSCLFFKPPGVKSTCSQVLSANRGGAAS